MKLSLALLSLLFFVMIIESASSQCYSEERYWEIDENAGNKIGLKTIAKDYLECYEYFISVQDTAFALYSLNYGIFYQINQNDIYEAQNNLQLLERYLKSSRFIEDHKLYTDFNYLRATLYYNLGNSDLCIFYANKYVKLLKDFNVCSYANKAIYDFLGVANIAIGDYHYSISNLKRSLSLSHEGDYLFNSRIQGHIAYSYIQLKDTINAKKYLSLAEKNISKDKDHADGFYYYQYLASYYLELNNTVQAKKYIELALQKNTSINGKINLLILKGQAQLLENDSVVNETFQQAYTLCLDSLGFNKYKVSEVLLNIGESYLKQNEFELSLNYLDLCIDLLWDDPENLQTILNPRILVEAMTHKSYILSQQDKNKLAMNQALQSTTVLSYLLKYKIHSIHSSTAFISKIKDQYSRIIESFNHANLGEYSFILNQTTKALLLRIKIDETNAFKQFDLSEDEISRITKLKNEISILNSFIANPGKSISLDSMEVLLQEKASVLDSLIENIELTTPFLYELKYAKQKTQTFSNLQQNISANTTLIEYYLGEKTLYTFIIDKEGSHVLTSEIDSSFTYHIYNLNSHIRSIESNVSYDSYLESSEYLYNILLKEIIDKINPKTTQLSVIPDNEINYIPFSALFEKAPEIAANGRYDHLPFLGKKFDISYHYSSALLDYKNSLLSSELSGFAPSFESDYSNSEDLDQLLHNQQEILLIKDITDGQIHVDTAATLLNLHISFNDYKIAHLATHATCNDTLPFESKIHLEDGPIYAYEIYNMPHNLDLAVLSACQTGDGALKKGEGLMSLARAFISSGCKSVITSLWNVNDRNGSLLMQSFYKHLWAGNNISKSLAQSKRDYLNNVNSILQAHPYHWATFVAIGNGDLAIFRIPWGDIFILTILLLLISIFLLRIFRNN